ncbi:MAG: type II CAAX endopeptidase family protein [Arenimonas sp.]
MIKKILFDPFGKLRNGWWFFIFFLIMAAILGTTMLAAWKFHFEISMPIQAGIILLASWICQRMRKCPLAELLGKFNAGWFRQFLIGNTAGAALMLFPALFLASCGLVRWQWNPDAQATILSGLLLCISVAFAEELMFRGFIFQRFIKGLGLWPAQLILAGWFLLTHLNNPGMSGNVKLLAGLNIFLASIMFGLAFIRTKSLAMPIGLHFMANWMQGSVLGFGVSGTSSFGLLIPQFKNAPAWLTGGQFGLEASIPGLVCVLAAILCLYRWKPSSHLTFETAKVKNRFA